MGENLAIEGRLSVRTPMQWTGEPTAGFSTARPGKFRRPITEGRFGPLAINVEDQRRDRASMLNWMERMIRRRRETPELGSGELHVLEAGTPGVLAHQVSGADRTIVLIHNLAPEPAEISLSLTELKADDADIIDLLDGMRGVQARRGRLDVTLAGYGHRWLAFQLAAIPRPP